MRCPPFFPVGTVNHLDDIRTSAPGQTCRYRQQSPEFECSALGTSTEIAALPIVQCTAGSFQVRSAAIRNNCRYTHGTRIVRPVSPWPKLESTNLADGIVQRSHLPQSFDHAVNPLRRKFQPIHQRRIQPFLTAPAHILGVGLHQLFATGIDGLRDREQGTILFRSPGTGNPHTGRPCLPPHFQHISPDITHPNLELIRHSC